MLTIVYHKDGLLFADEKALFVANNIVEAYKLTKEMLEDRGKIHDNSYVVANFIVIDAFRVLIKRKVIDPSEIQFGYEDKKFFADKDGRIADWPNGFGDEQSNLLMELM